MQGAAVERRERERANEVHSKTHLRTIGGGGGAAAGSPEWNRVRLYSAASRFRNGLRGAGRAGRAGGSARRGGALCVEAGVRGELRAAPDGEERLGRGQLGPLLRLEAAFDPLEEFLRRGVVRGERARRDARSALPFGGYGGAEGGAGREGGGTAGPGRPRGAPSACPRRPARARAARAPPPARRSCAAAPRAPSPRAGGSAPPP